MKFWNFSAGIQGNFLELDKIMFSLLVTYSTLTSEENFENLNFENVTKKYSAGSKDDIGLSFPAYFDIF